MIYFTKDSIYLQVAKVLLTRRFHRKVGHAIQCYFKCLNALYLHNRPVARYGLSPPWGNFVEHDFLEASCLARFCNMLALWQWKRYRITAHNICYLSKNINLTLKEQKLESCKHM